jgi:hypothetical protein
VVARRERSSLFCARVALDGPARGRSSSPLGAGMRVPLTTAVVAAALLFQADAQADPTLAERFNSATAVVLVRVVESTYGRADTLHGVTPTAKLLVMRSWKGPFRPGATVDVGTKVLCAGGNCAPYPFQTNQEVVVLVYGPIYGPRQTIFPDPESVIDGDHVEDAKRVLDEAAAKNRPLTIVGGVRDAR